MSGNGSGAYELKHCGKIHRVSDFSELKDWATEGRVTAEDSYRAAGTDEWLSVMNNDSLASILNPESYWVVTMKNGEFRAREFETIVRWAEEGRITEDAVVEGPRTPPGGVMASALPALASNLKKQLIEMPLLPVLRIDGRQYTAPDTDTIRKWIKGSRVPVEAEISLEGKNWEPVSSCGLFDLEDWPSAAHGSVEEESLPQMPEVVKINEPVISDETDHESEADDNCIYEEDEAPVEGEEIPFTVVTVDSEITVESAAKLYSLLKQKRIFSYDELKHPSILDERVSVGEYLDSVKCSGRGAGFWVLCGLACAVTALAALEYFAVLDFVTWL